MSRKSLLSEHEIKKVLAENRDRINSARVYGFESTRQMTMNRHKQRLVGEKICQSLCSERVN
jgi:predicted nucleotidyltransferase